MKIFVDNNIIIDFLVQQRANHKEAVTGEWLIPPFINIILAKLYSKN